MALVLLQWFTAPVVSAARDIDHYMQEAKDLRLPVVGYLSSVEGAAVQPSTDVWEQWLNSLQMRHPLLVPPRIEPAIGLTMKALASAGPAVVQGRRDILSSIRVPKESLREQTVWFRKLPSRSPGWHPRTDDWYDHPSFAALNRLHVQHRTQRPRADPEWRAMLDEVLQEREQGRVEGPFRTHPSWGFQAVGAAQQPTTTSFRTSRQDRLALPLLLVLFKKVLTDVRRCACEHYRRSHHNSTIRAFDKPLMDRSLHQRLSCLARGKLIYFPGSQRTESCFVG